MKTEDNFLILMHPLSFDHVVFLEFPSFACESMFWNYLCYIILYFIFFFFQAEDGIRDDLVTGVQTCALPIYLNQPDRTSGSGFFTQIGVKLA